MNTASDDRSDEDETPVNVSAIVKSGDLAKVVSLKNERSLTNEEKMYVLNNSFVPHPGYKFPTCSISGSLRHFQPSWLEKYSGLVYSESADGGFCKYCVVFGPCEPPETQLTVLVTKPLVNFKKASEKLDHHFLISHSHKLAIESARVLQNSKSSHRPTVEYNTSAARSREQIKATVYCGNCNRLW